MGEMKVEEMLVVFLFVGLTLNYLIYEPFMDYWENSPPLSEQLISYFISVKGLVILGCIFGMLLLYLFIKYRIKKIRERQEEEDKQRRFEIEKEEIGKLIEGNFGSMSIWELKSIISDIKSYKIASEFLSKHEGKVKNRLIMAKLTLRLKELEEELEEISSKKDSLEDENEELKNELYEFRKNIKDDKDAVFKKLNVENSMIYELDDLDSKEIEILKKEGFEETYEYDPIGGGSCGFLVKNIMNHSATHTFLVYRIQEMLEDYDEISEVETHDTRDADITFRLDSKFYAIEVETGSLLSKKDQFGNKVKFLNSRFGKNGWIFVVSNRDLVKKYK